MWKVANSSRLVYLLQQRPVLFQHKCLHLLGVSYPMPSFQLHFKDGSATDVVALNRNAALAMYPNATGVSLRGRMHSAPIKRNKRELSIVPARRLIVADDARCLFSVDNDAVLGAIAELDLRERVAIRFHARYGSTGGNYRRKHDGSHDIMVKSYLTPARASAVLWHELCHAMQSERCGRPADWYAHTRAQRAWRYDVRPIELEARAMADAHTHVALCA